MKEIGVMEEERQGKSKEKRGKTKAMEQILEA